MKYSILCFTCKWQKVLESTSWGGSEACCAVQHIGFLVTFVSEMADVIV